MLLRKNQTIIINLAKDMAYCLNNFLIKIYKMYTIGSLQTLYNEVLNRSNLYG